MANRTCFTRSALVVLLAAACAREVACTYNFLSIGDWGGAAINEQDSQNVYAVANQMDKTAGESDTAPSFIISLGDLFYWCGIQNTSDYQINVDFVEPYSTPNLKDLDWFNILGNHEYGYNSTAVLDYSSNNSHWIIPDRYYSTRKEIDADSETYMTMIFLDTSPCVADYRYENPSGWDPCNPQYPTCSHAATDDDFEGSCDFHEHIMEQDCTAQYEWLETTLQNVPKDDWVVVSGHHPLDEVNVFDFTSLLQRYGFSIYLNGHAHTLSFYQLDGGGAYVTSGAGSLVDTPDQQMSATRGKVKGDAEIHSDGAAYMSSNNDKTSQGGVQADSEERAPEGGAGAASHTYTTVWNQAIAGFTTHAFDSDFTSLRTDYVAYTGDILYSFTSYKNGTVKGH